MNPKKYALSLAIALLAISSSSHAMDVMNVDVPVASAAAVSNEIADVIKAIEKLQADSAPLLREKAKRKK